MPHVHIVMMNHAYDSYSEITTMPVFAYKSNELAEHVVKNYEEEKRRELESILSRKDEIEERWQKFLDDEASFSEDEALIIEDEYNLLKYPPLVFYTIKTCELIE